MQEPSTLSWFEVGGSLSAHSPTYVVRRVDDELLTALRAGELCYILNARQMGKSSLRVRTMEQLRASGISCADVDLSLVGSQGVTAEQWYAGVMEILASRLDLFVDGNSASWWRAQSLLAPGQRLAKFFEEVLLSQVNGNIVLFFEEVDTVLDLEFGDDFFSLLRACFEQRTTSPDFGRLIIVLIGVAAPADLVQDTRRSPFNVGRAIQLEGFRLEEARPALLPGLNQFSDPETVLREILSWTGGQPFLTQKLCVLAATSLSALAPGEEAAWLAELVRVQVIDGWETHDEPVHLQTIRDRVLRSGSQRTTQLLGLYRKVLLSGNEAEENTPETIELRLSGLVVERHGRLKVTNRIYASIFNLEWVDRELANLRPYAVGMTAWLDSGRVADSHLLRGTELATAREWAADKYLSDEDHLYLAASEAAERQRIEKDLSGERAANEILRTARKNAGVWSTVGALIAATLVAVALTYSWMAARDAQKKIDLAKEKVNDLEVQARRLDIQVQMKDAELGVKEGRIHLAQERLQGLTRSFREEKIRGEAANYAAAIGHDPTWIAPEEMEVFQRIGGSADEVRFAFLHKALASNDAARRLSRRLDIAIHAVVGLSVERRQRMLNEIVLPCLRDVALHLEIRQICAKLGKRSGGSLPELATLFSSLHRETFAVLRSPREAVAVADLLDMAGLFSRTECRRAWKIVSSLPPPGWSSTQLTLLSPNFWIDMATSCADHLPPEARRSLLGYSLVVPPHDTLTRLPQATRPSDALEVFYLVLNTASNWSQIDGGKLRQCLEGLVAKMTPEEAGIALMDLLNKPVDPRESQGIEIATGLEALSRRARPKDVASAGENVVAEINKLLHEGFSPSYPTIQRLRFWTLALEALPVDLKGPTGVRMMTLLIDLSGSAGPVAPALQAVARKMAPRRAERLLIRALRITEAPAEIASLVSALAILPGTLRPADGRMVTAKLIKNLWNRDQRDFPRAATLIAHRLDLESARTLALRSAESVQALSQRLSERNFLFEAEDLWSKLGERFFWSAGILAALPEKTELTDVWQDLLPVTRFAMLCNEAATCTQFAMALKRLPIEVDMERALALADVSGPVVLCGSNSTLFGAILSKVPHASQHDVAVNLLRRLAKPDYGFTERCYLVGLGALQNDLLLEEIDQVFNFLAEPHLGRAGFKEEWKSIAGRIVPSQAHLALDAQAARLWEVENPRRRELAAQALPRIAARVEPRRSAHAFARLASASAVSSRDEVNTALADSIEVLPGEIPLADLMDFLAQPSCVGRLREAVLARLEQHGGPGVGTDIWAAVVWAKQRGITPGKG